MSPFNGLMKHVFLALFSLMISTAYAEDFNITCSNGQCAGLFNDSACSSIVSQHQCEAKVLNNMCSWISQNNANGGICTALPQTKTCVGYNCPSGGTISVLRMSGPLDKSLIVTTDTAAATPQNLGLSVNGGDNPGINTNISLSAQNQTSNAANVILIGDNFNNLNVNLDGYSGKQGKSASNVCADNVKSGAYGLALQTYFNNRRATTSADPNRCDADDLNYMQSFGFTCEDAAYQEVSSVDPTVQVSQVKKQAKCTAVASFNYCIKRKVNVTCNFSVWSSYRQKYVSAGDLTHNSITRTGPQSCFSTYNRCMDDDYSIPWVDPAPTGACSGGGGYCFTPGVACNSSGNVTNPNQLCRYNASGGNPCAGYPNRVIYRNTTYQKVDNCTPDPIATMPLQRTVVMENVDEPFLVQEVARLGSLDRFCDTYAQKPARTNGDWWGGTGGGAPSNTLGSANGASSVELNGIPWTFLGKTGLPTPNNLDWRNETQINGGYTPSVVSGTSCTYETGKGNVCSSEYRVKDGYWKGRNSSQVYTAPGLNPDGLSLAVGSNWELNQSNTFESCASDFSTLRNVFLNLVQYTNKENTSCSGITDPQDPNNRAFWQYAGEDQDPAFGTEEVSCTIGSCAVGSSVSDLSRSLQTIVPMSGENGTEQGRGLIFAYNIRNANVTAVTGGAGPTGIADISINPQTRICAKIDDANAGINTPQARNPFVSFKRYQWQAVRSIPGGNPGMPPQNTGKTVEIYKKIDPAARYLLDKSLL